MGIGIDRIPFSGCPKGSEYLLSSNYKLLIYRGEYPLGSNSPDKSVRQGMGDKMYSRSEYSSTLEGIPADMELPVQGHVTIVEVEVGKRRSGKSLPK
ncbi:MAG: hypothetical protein UT00_C0012G0011 [Parcubacteria group bacterium GW2011_GWA1_38_7]|nr:MAG: hypothetical protein UT00_C0012G0011 [Parcubacteria group bacterium GW2011_GWA1_38_7]